MLLVFGSSCGRPGVEKVSIKGSDTEVNLVLQLAETFMKDDPDVSIAVTGGGSGAGISALLNGKADIANSSRPFKSAEIEIASGREIDAKAIIFAIDALVLVVNPATRMDSLSLAQVGAIFRGDFQNWSDLGGPNMPISLYGRQSNSGTFVFFREHILRDEYSQDIKQMNGTAQIIEAVKSDPAAIGYVGIGYVVNKVGEVMEGIGVVKIQTDSSQAALNPVEKKHIISGAYPITRPLFQYVNGQASGKLLEFIRFELSSAGQRIVQENGYFPISSQQAQHNQSILPGL
ncbi:MAG: phosphate ABC transporter substrate-binding protein [Bacteroidota bacterium]